MRAGVGDRSLRREEGDPMRCWDCGERPGRGRILRQLQLCRECRERMVRGLTPLRPVDDKELARAVLGGPGIRRLYH